MRAVILSIGDELVLGQTVDTNSAWLAARLAAVGIPCIFHHTVADDEPAVTQAITLAAKEADLVLISGGIGPTEDDLTRQALAAAMGVELVENAQAAGMIEAFFAGRGKPMPERNRAQAMCPAGGSMIDNSCGTAPGIRASLGKAAVYVMPGVPREMKVMYERSIEPEILGMGRGNRGVILTLKVNTFGWGESNVAERLGPGLMDRNRNPKVGTTVSDGIVAVRIRSEFPTPEQAQDELDATLEQVNERLGPIVFGIEEETLQGSVVRLLERRGKRLVVVESCTGGLLSKLLTDIPGCSTAFMGGWIVYSNVLKNAELDVPKRVLDEHGAVSEQTVRLLAGNALNSCAADVSLAVSGIAGPGGGTEDKPIGTVWLGMGLRDEADADHVETQAVLLRLSGGRDAIRDRAAKSALQMLRFHLLDQSPDLLQWGRATAPAKA